MKSGNETGFGALTGLRMLAASMVFLYHNRKYWQSKADPELFRFLNESHMGVAIFFVLSGFLISYNYAGRPLQSRGQYLRYLALRAARIFPLYWLILTARYADWGFPHAGAGLATYSLFHAFSERHNLDAISQAWSLNVEMCFYFLAPLLYFLLQKKLLYPILFCLLLLAAAAAVGWILILINGNSNGILFPFNFLLQSTFFGRFMEFLWGMGLAAFLQGHLKWHFLMPAKGKTIIGTSGIISLLYLLDFLKSDAYAHGTEHPLGILLCATLFPWLVICMIHGLITEQTLFQGFLASGLMQLLGKASFAFYLIHISYVSLRLRECLLLPDRNFVLLWIVSVMLYLVFEHPVNRLLRCFIQNTANGA